MHRIGQGRLRRLGVTASLVVVAALAVVSATAASVDVGDAGSAAIFRVSDAEKGKVFVCKYVGTPGVDERLQTGDNPIDVSVNAIPDYHGVGSWFADAHGRSYVVGPEHEANEHVDEPSVSSCPSPAPDDACPNLNGVQETVPDGYVKDEQGNCVQPPPPPTDVCPNIEGNQAEIPADMVKDEGGNCVLPLPPPNGGTAAKHLVVTKTARTSWYKVYEWDVEKSVDTGQLDLTEGETGTVEWKVDVKRTGWTARYMAVSGTITVANPNDTAVTGVVLTDELPSTTVFCGSDDAADLTVPANGSVSCIYAAPWGSTLGGTNTATAVGSLNGVDVSDTGTADFTFDDRPSYEINKTVKAVDGKHTWDGIDETTSFTYGEQFPCSSEGRTNVVDLLGDNPSTLETETDYKLATDSASVAVQCSGKPSTPPATPPPPPPPPPTVKSDELMDVQVTKDATPQVQLVNGQAEIAYTIRVRNNGPNQAHGVTLVDAAPGGVTFVAVTQQPSAGSCTVTSALLSCSLDTLGPGVERTIGLSARVGQTGTFVNSATATGNGKDTNGANNTDDASTLVTAPATPPAPPTPRPAPKPEPKPHVTICRVLKVTPGIVKANGNRQLVLAKVTHLRTPVAGVAVRFSGKGLSKVVKTNAQGVARVTIAPRKAGIMLVKITSAKACNTARIGVIGAFEPPVTG